MFKFNYSTIIVFDRTQQFLENSLQIKLNKLLRNPLNQSSSSSSSFIIKFPHFFLMFYTAQKANLKKGKEKEKKKKKQPSNNTLAGYVQKRERNGT